MFCLGFQVVHAFEHVLQLGYWAIHPTAAPWTTPWAVAGRDLLAGAADGQTGSGNELLHLFGNVIFLAGLAGLLSLLRWSDETPHHSLLVAGWLQTAHVIEHVALTTSWFLVGRAVGVTTLLGTLEGSAGASVRVWAHFLINMIATAYLVHGLVTTAKHHLGWLRRPSSLASWGQ